MLISVTLPGQAATDAGDELRLQVRRLVRELDDVQRTTREAAEHSLIELGPPVLDLLPAPGRDTSAEVKVRLERVRKALESAVAEAARSRRG